MKKNKPFLLFPVGKDYLWGGEKLVKDFNKDLNLRPLAETWECSTNSHGESLVWSGEFKGKTLKEVLTKRPELLGKLYNKNGSYPLIIKLIDACKDLSIQVHPNNYFAKKYGNVPNGKTEMWYILDCEKDSEIIYGFNKEFTTEEIKDFCDTNTLITHLNKITPHKGDVILIKSGVVHAIGKGIIVAEIQQNCDITYRLYDYDRIDANGEKRALHVQKGIKALDIKENNTSSNVIKNFNNIEFNKKKLMCKTKFFSVFKIRVKEKFRIKGSKFQPFILMNIEGKCKVLFDDSYINLKVGNCVFVPAHSYDLFIEGDVDLLYIRG